MFSKFLREDLTKGLLRCVTGVNKYSSFPVKTVSDKISLTRRAYTLCSPIPKHLQPELQFLKPTFLANGYPLSHILLIMDQTRRSIGKSNPSSPNKPPNSSVRLQVVSLYNPRFAKNLTKALARYDIETSFRTTPHALQQVRSQTSPN